MLRLLFPIALFLVLSSMSLWFLGAPLRVQALAIGVLAMALLLPSVVSAFVHGLRARILACVMFSLGAILTWDLTASLVIVKLEPLYILSNAAWLYVLGVAAFTVAGIGVSWVVAPPDNALKLDDLRQLRVI